MGLNREAPVLDHLRGRMRGTAEPHGAARRGAKCRDPLRGRDAACGGLQGPE